MAQFDDMLALHEIFDHVMPPRILTTRNFFHETMLGEQPLHFGKVILDVICFDRGVLFAHVTSWCSAQWVRHSSTGPRSGFRQNQPEKQSIRQYFTARRHRPCEIGKSTRLNSS